MGLLDFFKKKKDEEEQPPVIPANQLSPLQKTILDVGATIKDTFPVLNTIDKIKENPIFRTILSAIPGIGPAIEQSYQLEKMTPKTTYQPKKLELDVSNIPLVREGVKLGEGLVEGATFGLVDLPIKKSKTTTEKLAYGLGNLAGLMSPGGVLSKGAKGITKIGQKAISKSIPLKVATETGKEMVKKLATKGTIGKIASGVVKSVATGAPYGITATGLNVLKGEIKPEDIAKEMKKQALWDVGFGAAGSALPVLGFAFAGGIKEKQVETAEELASKVAKTFEKKAGEGITVRLSDLLKKFNISNDLLDKLDKKPLVGENFSIQKTGKDIEFIFDEGFRPMRIVKPAIKANTKELKPSTEEIKPEIPKLSTEPLVKKRGKVPETPPPSSEVNLPLSIVKRETSDVVPKFTPQEIPPVKEPRTFYQSLIGQAIPEEEFTSSYLKEKAASLPEGEQKESVNKILETSKKLKDEALSLVRNTPKIREEKLLGGFWDKIGATKVINSISDRLREAGITNFAFRGDRELDEETRNATVFILNKFRGRVENELNIARKAASEVLGRRITDEELNALIRNEVDEIYRAQQKGATKVKLGEEFFTEKGLNQEKINELKNLVKGVGEEIQAQIVAYESMLDDLLAAGGNKEAIEKARLAGKEEIWNNLGSYLKTTYNSEIAKKVLGGDRLYKPALFEFANYTPSQKAKLTLQEWANGYINFLKEENVPFEKYIPENLLEGVLAGRKEDTEALGRLVKEMAGYETGIEGITKTMSYVATNFYNLLTQKFILENPELTSSIPKEGFVKINEKNFPALYGKYVREDIVKDLFEMVKNQQQIGDIFKLYSSLWKYGMVIGRPAAWVRNFLYGEFVQQTLAGNSPLNPLNWKYFAKAKDFIQYFLDPRKASKEMELFVKNGGGGGSFVSEEVKTGMLDFLKEFKFKKGDSLNMFDKLVTTMLQKGADLGQTYSLIDSLNKFILFSKRLEKGDTVEQAIMYSNKYLNNYALNPKLFRELSKNPFFSMVFPFISFVVANSPTLVETFLVNPHRIALFLSPFLAYNTITRLTNPEFYQQAEIQKPYYQKDNLLYLPISQDEETGKVYYFDASLLFNLPVRTDIKNEAVELAKSLAGSFIQPGGAIQPIITAVSGKDIFGQEVDVPYGEGRVGALVKMLPFGLSIDEASELISDLLGKPYSSSGKVRVPPEAIANYFGFNVYHTLPNQLKKNIDAATREAADFKARANSILKSPEVKPEDKLKVLQQVKEKEQEKVEKISSYLKPFAPEIKKIYTKMLNKEIDVNQWVDKGGVSINNKTIPQIDLGKESSSISPAINLKMIKKLDVPKVNLKIKPIKKANTKGVKLTISQPPAKKEVISISKIKKYAGSNK